MSLFGKADENLPTLTKLLQLEFDDHTGEGDTEPFILSFLESRKHPDYVIPPVPQGLNERAAVLRRIGNFIRLMQRFIDAAEREQPAQVDDWFEVNKLLSQFTKPEIHSQGYGKWAISYFKVPEDNYFEDPLKWDLLLKNDVLPVLLRVIDHRLYARCPACSNVYYRTRADQKYCSLRCGGRARMRKQREKVTVSLDTNA